VAQNQISTYINFLKNLITMAHANSLLEILHRLKISMAHINSHTKRRVGSRQ